MKKITTILIPLLASFALSAQTPPFDLEELFLLARADNPSLERLRADSEGARAAEEKARAEKFPLLTGMAGYSYVAFPQEGITVEAGELGTIPGIGSLPSEDIVFMEDMKNNYYQLGLSLTQPLYTWGKLDLALQAARAGGELRRAALSLEERKIRTELETLLTSLAVLNMTEGHLTAEEETLPRLIRIVRESYDKGFLLKTDVLEAEMLARQTAVARRELTQRKEEIFRRVGSLTGLDRMEESLLDYAYPGDLWTGDAPPDREVLWEKLLRNNGELRQLEAGLEALRRASEIGEIRKSHLPDLGFQLDLKYAADILPFEEEEWYSGNITATATLVLKGSLFDGGRDRYDFEEARAEEKSAEARYGETLRTLRESLEREIDAGDLLAEKILYEEAKLRKIGEEREIKRSLWQAGAEGEEEYLKKILEEESAEIERLSQVLLYFQSRYRLNYLTGGDE